MTKQQNQTTKLTKEEILDKQIQIYQQTMKKLNLSLPENLSSDEAGLWNQFFDLLISGYLQGVVFREDIELFKVNFARMDLQQKKNYLIYLKIQIETAIANIEELIEGFHKENVERHIENIKNTLPEENKKLFEYIIYSLLSGQEIDKDLLEEYMTYLSLTPEQKQQLHELELAKKFGQMKSGRNRFKASDLDGVNNFNTALNEEMIAQLIEGNQSQKQKHFPSTTPPINNQPHNTKNPNSLIANKPRLGITNQSVQQINPIKTIPGKRISTQAPQPQHIPTQNYQPQPPNQAVNQVQKQAFNPNQNIPPKQILSTPQTSKIPNSFPSENNYFNYPKNNQSKPLISNRIFNSNNNPKQQNSKGSFLKQRQVRTVRRQNKGLQDLLS